MEPLPHLLQHMVWSQGMSVAAQLAYLPQLRTYAVGRCADSEQHYIYGSS